MRDTGTLTSDTLHRYFVSGLLLGGPLRIDASDGSPIDAFRCGESRWDPDSSHFVPVPKWWSFSGSGYIRVQSLVYSSNPTYIPDDGWIRTLGGSLLLWVTPEHRTCSCHAASESAVTTNPCDGWLANSVWRHVPRWADVKSMMTEDETERD